VPWTPARVYLSSMTRALALGVAGTAVAVALATVSVAVVVIGVPPAMTTYELLWLALALPPMVAGWFLLRHERSNLIGALLVLVGTSPLFISSGDGWAAAVEEHPSLPVSGLIVTLSAGSWMLLYIPSALVILLFPDGQVPGPRWRPVLWGLVVVPVLWIAMLSVYPEDDPAPFTGRGHVFGVVPAQYADVYVALTFVPLLGLLALLVATAAAPVVRYRRSDESARRPLRALFLGSVGLPLTLLMCWASYLLLGVPDLALVGLVFTWVTLPVATAIGVLRHDLYGIDRALSASLTYGALSTGALAVGTVLGVVTGTLLGQGNPTITALLAVLSVLAVLPLRRRVSVAIDRLAYPARHRLRVALTALADDVGSGAAEPSDLVTVLRDALEAPGLVVAYPLSGSDNLVDRSGQVVLPGPQATTLRVADRPVAVIDPGRPLPPALGRETQRLAAPLAELAQARLQADVARLDAEASRTRLLRTGYEERRRLERDLHDGAQQRLVSLGMALRLAQRHLDDDATELDAVLDDAVAELGTAVAELRQLAHGIRPSCLDDGLAPALAGLVATSPVPVLLDIDDANLPDDVVVTAYFVVLEAVTNAVKHAAAGRVVVRVRHAGAALEVEVADDGIGGADPAGSGLSGVGDRVAAAGGTVTVVSPPGQGTSVHAVLPCAS
jgi:signal transduction histidine kinase